jgi:hypothetical protein
MKKPNLKTVNKGGRGFGALDQSDRNFLTPDYDDKRQSGQRYVFDCKRRLPLATRTFRIRAAATCW